MKARLTPTSTLWALSLLTAARGSAQENNTVFSLLCSLLVRFFFCAVQRQSWGSFVAADRTGNTVKFESIKLLLRIGPLSLDRALPGRLETIVGRHTGQVRRSLELCFKLLPFLGKHFRILISLENGIRMTSVHSYIGLCQWFQFYPADSGDSNASQAAVCWIRPMLGSQLRVSLIQSLTLATGKLKKKQCVSENFIYLSVWSQSWKNKFVFPSPAGRWKKQISEEARSK